MPLLYLLVAYLLLWALGLGDLDQEQIIKISSKVGFSSVPSGIIVYVILITLFGAGSRLFAAIGEETGWRGYLLPTLLEKYKPVPASIIVGIIWAVWHYPLFGFPASESDFVTSWLPLINFTIMVLALSIIYTRFLLTSDSIWTSFMLHTSHNLFLQSVFNPLTKWNKHTELYADETGLLLMVILVCIAVYAARKINSMM